MLGMPRGTTLEKLTFGDILAVKVAIVGECVHKNSYHGLIFMYGLI